MSTRIAAIAARALAACAIAWPGCAPPRPAAPDTAITGAPREDDAMSRGEVDHARSLATTPTLSPQPLPPLSAPGPFVELAVPSHASAVVSLPRGATAPRPLIVATHGAGGTPEAHCAFWRGVVGDAAFVLCPRGVTSDPYAPPEERGYFYPTHLALEREVDDAVSAVRERFAAWIDADRPVYAGFSQGATMGALFFARRRGPFAGAILVEGGFDEWSLASAQAFKAGGGGRVVFACGRAKCVDAARRSARLLGQAGVEASVVYGEGAGHTYEGAVGSAVAKAFPWVIEGDPRWR